MPFDNSTELDQETKNRNNLLWYLRNDPETRINWDFLHSETCAMGACRRLGFDQFHIGFRAEEILFKLFFIKFTDSGYRAIGYGGVHTRHVTPDMVADAIEEAAKKLMLP